MHLSIESIREEATNTSVFNRGKVYYFDGRVDDVAITRDENGACEICANVQGSELYSVSVHLSCDGEITYYDCDCPAMAEYPGICKHCVAVLLQAHDEMQRRGDLDEAIPSRASAKEAKLSAESHATSAAVTSEWAKRLLNTYETREKLNDFNQPDGKVSIEPTISLKPEHNEAELTLKVGIGRMFVVKDVGDFLRYFEIESVYSYGKSLTFKHCDDVLDQESLLLLRFLHKYFSANELIRIEQRRAFDRKTFFLSGTAFDELFDLYAGKSMPRVVYSRTRGKRSSLEEDFSHRLSFLSNTPNTRISVEAADNRAICLRWHEDVMFWGRKTLYLLRGDDLYRCSIEQSKALGSFLTAFVYGKGSLIFSDQDASAFCSSVLPEIKPYVAFSDPKELLKQYMPESMNKHAFIDAPDRNTITCTLAVEYGGDMLHLLVEQRSQPFISPFPVPDDRMEADDQVGEGEWIVDGAIVGGSEAQDAIPSVVHHRDNRAERLFAADVERLFPQKRNETFYITGDDAIFELLTEGVEKLQAIATIHISDRLRRYAQASAARVNVGVTLDSGLLQMDIDLERFSPEELLEALSAYRERRKYYRLKDGAFLKFSDGALRDIAQMADGLQLTDKELLSGRAELPAFRALYLDGLFSESNRKISVHKNTAFKQLVRTIKDAADSDYTIPEALRSILRSYQETGYRWLRALEECGLCGILADDMGLGKTIQIITLLLDHYSRDTNGKPSLIACPASLVLNWQAELAKFAPELPVRIIMGTASVREELIRGISVGEVVVTSYDLLKRDIQAYHGLRFQVFTIDEAQCIKNHMTKSAHAVKEIDCVQRYALTGTPIENRLSELWSIFDFLMPGYLFHYNRFRQRFETPIVKSNDEDARAQLKRMIAPFVLRRLKRDVLSELPPKVTSVLPVEFDDEQRTLYNATLVSGIQNLKATQGENIETGSSAAKARIKVLALLTRLRQICCDPSLCFENYTGESAKLESCMELIRQAQGSGHKLLLFSQFTSMLAIIEKRLMREGISYYLLQGSTPKEERLEMADRFNADDTTVFLISLKAGGTGLNLTGADMVIHYDPWWNLAAQEQATDRAHRIGQSKSLQVYRLIAKGTIEEKIIKLQEMKGDLASIVDGDGENAFAALSAKEWIELLGA